MTRTSRRLTGAALLLFALVAPHAAAAPPAYDIRGTWDYTSTVNGTDYQATLVFTTVDCATGAISGHGSGGSYTWPESGTIDGTKISTTDGPYDQLPGYTASSVGTFSDADHYSGQVSSNQNQQGTFVAVRKDGPPNDGKGCGAAATSPNQNTPNPNPSPRPPDPPKPDAAGKRASAVQVMCTWVVATANDICTATVADRGPQPAEPVTGSVSFKSANGGVFAFGATCPLRPTSLSPGIASCPVTFLPPSGTSAVPQITATYGGDARHAPSSGSTQFLTLAGPANLTSPRPYTLQLETEIPADGTQVEACAVAGAPSRPRAAQDDLAGDLTDLVARLTSSSQAEQARLQARLNTLAGQASQRHRAVTEQLRALEKSGPTEQARVQALVREQQQLNEALRKVIDAQSQACRATIRTLALGRPRTRPVGVRLARQVVRRARKGPLKLRLRLDRRALRRAAGRRGRVAVYVRVNQRLPASLLRGGFPRASVTRVTLSRAGKVVR